ncbi:RagB/SusD family nutrient uptake outer membrane protein [Flammeovirgaceae bacterium SG7u.111]|nr:RagB/SusD family nutrient uptake outer membrane protein [Flammeovirgaceae bacterium SG7u.132]WPO36456.1 RagB/SusD family nutrient uptake outer membrane protein [Flammeovirgaceae bacterium SG7u.111]
MKKTLKNIYKIGLLFIISLGLHSCNDEFLNTKPLDEVSQSDVWTDPALLEAYVNDIYRGVYDGGFHEEMIASMTDEAMFIHGRAISQVPQANVNDQSSHFTETEKWMFSWPEMYKYIRACNNFFENVAESPLKDEADTKRLMGEVHFMRAWFYHGLVKNYGGVPLISETYKLGADDYSIARNTYEESINFILSDLDAAATNLKGKTMDKGRTNYAAALAMKSEVLLYAASDLHDMPTASSKSTLIGGFSNKELLGYTSGDRTARWTAAKNAAMEVMNLGLSLAFPDPTSQEEAAENLYNMFMDDNSETIWSRYWIGDKNERGDRYHLNNGPNGYHNWAGNVPLQTLVDDFEMMDGSKFDWDNPDHAAAPFEDRDPRFYSTVLYDGADWRERPSDVASRDPYNQIQTGTYEKWDPNTNAVIPHYGLDTRQSPIEDWNGTRSGYYVKKFYDKRFNGSGERQEVPYPFFRYTEILLNYAEACIELGQDNEAKTVLNQIRKRAAMPDITESGDALKERYRNERRVELAYEDHRFFDGRRWIIGPTLHRPAVGLVIEGKLKSGKQVEIYKYSKEDYDYTYTPTELANEVRVWEDKMYFVPLQRDELNRNPQLVQNPGFGSE